MEALIKKYTDKLFKHDLTEKDAPVFGAIETDVYWNRDDKLSDKLNYILHNLNINSLLFSEPKEPYRSIINYLTTVNKTTIYPEDCETRTFLHDLPVANTFDENKITELLKKRKSVIVAGYGIISFGTVSPEQAFITYSSVCFACFVKFFSDYLKNTLNKTNTIEVKEVFKKVQQYITPKNTNFKQLMTGPFTLEKDVYSAIIEAGKQTIDYKLVDSFFGNISYRLGDTIYISQTSSSLDQLNGCIDPCPIDNSSCCGITASSELSAHKQIYLDSDSAAILHGHPKFSVIMSLFCQKENCKTEGYCHIKCSEKRFIEDIPIVPGEVGTGKYGLCNTLPPAMKGRKGTIVYGHGLFTASKNDFNEAFQYMVEIENKCMQKYIDLLNNNNNA